MKKSLHKIAEWFRASKKLNMANSYIKYQELEITALRERAIKDRFIASDRCNEINELEARNISLNEKNKRLLNLLDQMRELLHKRGSTDAERQFIRACVDIYANGKMISEQRFNAQVSEIVAKRSMACINRDKVGDSAKTLCGGER